MLLELADGRRVVLISVGEKRVSSLRVRVFGRAGHASTDPGPDNALRHAATAIDRLLDHRAPVQLTPATERTLEALGVSGPVDRALDHAAGLHPALAALVPPMARMTITPTGLRTHEPSNVIPPFADVICDCRTVPGQGEAEIREQAERALGADFAYELELLEPLEGGTESPTDTALYRACADYVADRVPGAVLLPMVTPGFTDSHWIRGAHGTVAYGFAPVFATDAIEYMDAAHGADEALAVADLVEMAEFHLYAIRELATA
jgi:acetylornithine deacetylase/succinyl-diaminopimelate desuccinylase-like protein